MQRRAALLRRRATRACPEKATSPTSLPRCGSSCGGLHQFENVAFAVQENREAAPRVVTAADDANVVALQKRKIGIEIGGAKCQRGAGERAMLIVRQGRQRPARVSAGRA